MANNPDLANIALFDMDGTLVDLSGQLAADLAPLAAPEEARGGLWDDHPHVMARMHLIKSQPGWWERLPRLQLGFDVLAVAEALDFDIHVLTKGPIDHTDAWKEKVLWCRRELDDAAKIHVTEDKSVVYGKVLVDEIGRAHV